MSNVEFHIGEVISNPNVSTYDYVDSNKFQISVKTYTDFYNQQEILAIPLNSNIKDIPRVGEHVLLVRGLSAENNSESAYPQWYWISSFALNSDVNSNFLQGVSQPQSIPYIPKTSFEEKEVSFKQPYEGDILIEGRFSNTIRLGSTVIGGEYETRPLWRGAINGDPIIAISNGTPYTKDSYVIENVEADASSIYLTSTQNIPNLLLGVGNQRNPLTKFGPSESQFSRSQLIGVADRIILKAKTDIAVIDAPVGIVLNTTGEVKIGSDDATESMVHGDVLVSILQNIILQLQSGIVVGDTYAPTGGYANGGSYVQRAQQLLQELLSSTYFIKKNTY
jgi:hypothetical protein